ncbi:unnamed protein product [Calypogeia fissa]
MDRNPCMKAYKQASTIEIKSSSTCGNEFGDSSVKDECHIQVHTVIAMQCSSSTLLICRPSVSFALRVMLVTASVYISA